MLNRSEHNSIQEIRERITHEALMLFIDCERLEKLRGCFRLRLPKLTIRTVNPGRYWH